MNEKGRYTGNELRLFRLIGGTLLILGWWWTLHGGLRLVDERMFSYERSMAGWTGRHAQTRTESKRECLGGIAFMLLGGALRMKAKEVEPESS
jgi:hypothetical protein